MTTRWARFTRGWVAAFFSTFVAALSHTVGGERAPGGVGVVVSVAFAGLVCVALAGRSLSWSRLAVSVVLSQLIFHTLFSVGAPGGALHTAGGAAHEHGTHAFVSAVGSRAFVDGAHGAHGLQMWLAHAVAACVTIVALRRGETALWGMLDLVRVAIRSLCRTVSIPARLPRGTRTRRAAGHVARPRAHLLLSAMRHRGPPARFARAS